MKYPGCSLENMVGYVKPVARKKLDTLVIHVETNELTKGVNTMKKVQKQSSRGVLRKSILKIYGKFTGEHPCRSAISIKLQRNFIEITLWHGCSPVYLLHIFRQPFPQNTFSDLLR